MVEENHMGCRIKEFKPEKMDLGFLDVGVDLEVGAGGSGIGVDEASRTRSRFTNEIGVGDNISHVDGRDVQKYVMHVT